MSYIRHQKQYEMASVQLETRHVCPNDRVQNTVITPYNPVCDGTSLKFKI